MASRLLANHSVPALGAEARLLLDLQVYGGTQPSLLPLKRIRTSLRVSSLNTSGGPVVGYLTPSSKVPGFDALGELLKPTMPAHGGPPPPAMVFHPGAKLLASDLDSSLANLVGNLQFGGTPIKKPDMQWSQQGEKKLTGGHNWQNKTMSTTPWTSAPMAPQHMPVPVSPSPMAFPMATPQVPVYGMVPPQMAQMGGVSVMAPQQIMYNQPVLRPTNPFAPIPGAQMQFM
ncbi:unnamed protein product [Boreogadus saida]